MVCNKTKLLKTILLLTVLYSAVLYITQKCNLTLMLQRLKTMVEKLLHNKRKSDTGSVICTVILRATLKPHRGVTSAAAVKKTYFDIVTATRKLVPVEIENRN